MSLLNQLESLLHASGGLSGAKYVTLVGLTALCWDHLLTFSQEIHLIWPASLKSKLAFFTVRYAVLGALVLSTYVTSGFAYNLSQEFCGVWLALMICFSLIYTAIADLIILMRVYTLWDYRKHVLRILMVGFMITYMTSLAFGIKTAVDVVDSVIYEDVFYHTCIVMHRPRFLPAIWASQAVFDLHVFLATVLNAAERPFRMQSELVSSLYRDGLYYFIAIFCSRIVLSIMSSIGNGDYSLIMPFFVWAMTSITVSRLLLRMEAMKAAAGVIAVQPNRFELTVRRDIEISSTM